MSRVVSSLFPRFFHRLLHALAYAGPLLLPTFLITATAILLSSTFLGERLVWGHIAGMGILGLGLAVIDGRFWGRSGRGAMKK
jgi:hypothetical protein